MYWQFIIVINLTENKFTRVNFIDQYNLFNYFYRTQEKNVLIWLYFILWL